MRFIKKISRLSKKTQGKLVIISLSVFVVAGLLLWAIFSGKIKPLAATIIIENIASLTYTDSTGTHTVNSNKVTTTVETVTSPVPSPVPSTPVPSPSPSAPQTLTINLALNLQGRASSAVSNATFTVYNAGTTTKVFEKTNVATTSTGTAAVTVTGLTSGTNYDYKVKVKYFLTSAKMATPFSDGMTIAYGLQKGGDLLEDNIINGGDFTYLSSKWFTADAIADINADSIVNGGDFTILSSNWFQAGK